LKGLEKAAKAGKISPLFGFGEKNRKKYFTGFGIFKKGQRKILLQEILPTARNVVEKLKKLKKLTRSVGGFYKKEKGNNRRRGYFGCFKKTGQSHGFFCKIGRS